MNYSKLNLKLVHERAKKVKCITMIKQKLSMNALKLKEKRSGEIRNEKARLNFFNRRNRLMSPPPIETQRQRLLSPVVATKK